jgi:hypothetical protein
MRVATSVSQHSTAPLEVFEPQSHQWVQLRERLSAYSFDQALLLCPETGDRWVAWVPDYGEAILQREQILKLQEF